MDALYDRTAWLAVLTVGVRVTDGKSGTMTMDHSLIPWSENYPDVKPVGEIYVVDDDQDMREILEGTLAAQGFPVKTFEDGDSFLAAAAERKPICVFLDVIMPRRSGIEVLQELRARHFWTPVFLTSARDDVPTVVEAMKSGALDYIKKPFAPSELVPRVHNAVEMWLRRVDAKQPGDNPPSENREWFHLNPTEKEMLLLMRLMDA